jgi:hypothetical protein
MFMNLAKGQRRGDSNQSFTSDASARPSMATNLLGRMKSLASRTGSRSSFGNLTSMREGSERKARRAATAITGTAERGKKISRRLSAKQINDIALLTTTVKKQRSKLGTMVNALGNVLERLESKIDD